MPQSSASAIASTAGVHLFVRGSGSGGRPVRETTIDPTAISAAGSRFGITTLADRQDLDRHFFARRRQVVVAQEIAPGGERRNDLALEQPLRFGLEFRMFGSSCHKLIEGILFEGRGDDRVELADDATNDALRQTSLDVMDPSRLTFSLPPLPVHS